MIKKSRDYSFEIKAAKKGGFFNGYASVFGIIDSYNERVMPGAFAETLADAAAKSRKFPILWQHKSDEPLGTYDVIREDSRGLYVEGRLLTETVSRAAEVHSLLMDGAVTGISIGFDYRESLLHEESGIRDLTRVWLYEASLVSFPANDESRIIEVRRKLDAGELPTITEFERSLRDAGWSRKQAAAIAAKGYRHLLSDSEDDDNEPMLAAVLQQFVSFHLPKIRE